MRIDIVSDAVCPWCFIGKRRLERALAQSPQTDLEIGWRPFQLNPEMPAEGMERQAYLRAKFGDRAGGDMYANVRAAGAEEGIPFAFDRIKRTPNTLLAHRFIRRAAALGRQNDIVEALFRAYFLDGQDIGAVATLVDIARATGLDAAETEKYLQSDEDAETVRAEDAYAREIGISGVPCFIVERKYAVSGAQPPEVLQDVFERVRRELAAGEPALKATSS
jgi:predicted DsbA family dithiol-disulfide isomerase